MRFTLKPTADSMGLSLESSENNVSFYALSSFDFPSAVIEDVLAFREERRRGGRVDFYWLAERASEQCHSNIHSSQ